MEMHSVVFQKLVFWKFWLDEIHHVLEKSILDFIVILKQVFTTTTIMQSERENLFTPWRIQIMP